MPATIQPPRRKTRKAIHLTVGRNSSLKSVVRRKEEEPKKDDCQCGKWNCNKCSCSRYWGTEEGGYKCKTCGHYYEDHRS